MGVIKRSMDLVLSSATALVVAPVVAVVGFVTWLRMGSPVLFRQTRAGLWGQPFTLLKIRTMRESAPGEDNAPDVDRMTDWGRFVRSASLDELPELWNVLRGEMSLVGPRPLLVEYLPLYSNEQMRRHEVRPGLTGLAQVNGRNAQTWEERLALDVWYVDHWSLWLDAKILAKTVVKVLAREGISAEGEATMPKFEGSRDG